MTSLFRTWTAGFVAIVMALQCSSVVDAQQTSESVDWIVATQSRDDAIGCKAESLSTELAKQIGIAAQGVLITDVVVGSVADQIGLKKYDIVTMIAETNLERPEDLNQYVLIHGAEPKKIKLRRAGKEEIVAWDSTARASESEAVGRSRVWYSAAMDSATDRFVAEKRFLLGVVLGPVDEVLRSQLGLEANQGLVITQVSNEGPAERAGCKKNDLLLELDSHKVTTEESLRQQVQKIGDKQVQIRVMRNGKLVELNIQPGLADQPLQERVWVDLYGLKPSSGVWNATTGERVLTDGHFLILEPTLFQRNGRAVGDHYFNNQSQPSKEESLAEIRVLLKRLEAKLDELSK